MLSLWLHSYLFMVSVKPDPVASLEIEPLNSTSVNVTWKRPPVLTDLLHLNYTLTLKRKPKSPLKVSDLL